MNVFLVAPMTVHVYTLVIPNFVMCNYSFVTKCIFAPRKLYLHAKFVFHHHHRHHHVL